MKRQSAPLAWFVMPTQDVEAVRAVCLDLMKAADQRKRRPGLFGPIEAPHPSVPGRA